MKVRVFNSILFIMALLWPFVLHMRDRIPERAINVGPDALHYSLIDSLTTGPEQKQYPFILYDNEGAYRTQIILMYR